jgi:hypothetical protein
MRDLQSRHGVMHIRVRGKRYKVRYVPLHAMAQRLIEEYLTLTGHGADAAGPLFRPVKNNITGELDRHLDPASLYRNVVVKYGLETGISADVNGLWCIRCAPLQQRMPSRMRRICQSPGVARSRERVHDAALRSAQDAPRR